MLALLCASQRCLDHLQIVAISNQVIIMLKQIS